MKQRTSLAWHYIQLCSHYPPPPYSREWSTNEDSISSQEQFQRVAGNRTPTVYLPNYK